MAAERENSLTTPRAVEALRVVGKAQLARAAQPCVHGGHVGIVRSLALDANGHIIKGVFPGPKGAVRPGTCINSPRSAG